MRGLIGMPPVPGRVIGPVNSQVGQPEGDVVHHDAVDHFVAACCQLSRKPGIIPQRAPPNAPARNSQGHVNESRKPGDGISNISGSCGAHEQLPFDTDIEQSSAESQRTGQPGKYVWSALHQAFQEWIECAADCMPGLLISAHATMLTGLPSDPVNSAR